MRKESHAPDEKILGQDLPAGLPAKRFGNVKMDEGSAGRPAWKVYDPEVKFISLPEARTARFRAGWDRSRG